MFFRFLVFTALALGPIDGFAKLKVVATTSDVGSLVQRVGGTDVEVSTIAKGSQDPHFVEAKPSFMVGVRNADLVVANGLSLEVGWLPNLIRGARNPKVNPGSKGYLELGTLVQPLDIPSGSVTRAMGDVHPEGNPHFMVDPVRLGELSVKLAAHLGELDPANKENFEKRAKAFQELMLAKTKAWDERVKKTGLKKVITYHPSLNYFLNRFGLSAPLYLENKPGIPPTAKHIIEVIKKMKEDKIRLILVDNFFDTKVAQSVAKEIPQAKIVSVGIAVQSSPNLKTSEDVIEELVKAIESAGNEAK